MKVPALHFECDMPPEPFEDEFPMISDYYLLEYESHPIMFLPEDDELITDTEQALHYIMRLAPLTHFTGGVEVELNATEEP
jgi:hypothetical protein